MKFLRNQGIVFVLAGLAIVLVVKNLLWPVVASKLARRSATRVTAAAPSPPSVRSNTPVTNAAAPSRSMSPRAQTKDLVPSVVSHLIPESGPVVPKSPMNVQELWNNGPSWASAPQRDPFRMRGGVNDKSAREQLTLTGILRQTASDLAVLNNRVMAAGDTILGFRLETVEADRVWVSGPNGREVLEFKYSVQTAPNAAETRGSVASSYSE